MPTATAMITTSAEDKVMVMRAGDVVEAGPAAQVFADPQSDYTRTLMAAAFGATESAA